RPHGADPREGVDRLRPSHDLARPARLRGAQAGLRRLPPALPVAAGADRSGRMNEDDWFEPRVFFVGGGPDGISSALRELRQMRGFLREEIEHIAPRTLLEIGPGDAPITDGMRGAVQMDMVREFLRPLKSPRVQGDLFAPPFGPAAFDLIVACD